MKGNNKLRINQATMIEAIQYWLNREMTNAQRVVNVRPSTDSYAGTSEFDIDLSDAENSGRTESD